MSYIHDMEAEPYRFDFLDMMRRVERSLGRVRAEGNPTGGDPFATALQALSGGEDNPAASTPRPRVGDSASRRNETIQIDSVDYLVSFGQEPHLDFPASNVARVEIERDSTRKRIRIYCKFLGLLGPQGALPYAITEEAFGYTLKNDHALPRFLDIFNQRFLQLFFRAWADSRPIVQRDRPELDRFDSYVRSTMGLGSPPFSGLEHIPEEIGLYAGLLAPTVKSASRLRYAIKGMFGVEAKIEQFVGSWLEFEPDERSLLGGRNSGLGTDLLVGKASFSVQDKFRVRVFVEDLAAYRRFLPDGDQCEKLVDLIFLYVGDELQWDVELALPAPKVESVKLGVSGALGWTTWMAPNYSPDEYRCDARFSPAERIAHRRKAQ